MFFVKIAEGWIRSRVHCCLQQLLYHCATTAAFDLNSLSGPVPASFYFRLFNTVDSRQMINIKIWRWPDSNRRPLASEGTSLPTEPQATLCSIGPCFQFNGFYKKNDSNLYVKLLSGLVFLSLSSKRNQWKCDNTWLTDGPLMPVALSNVLLLFRGRVTRKNGVHSHYKRLPKTNESEINNFKDLLDSSSSNNK